MNPHNKNLFRIIFFLSALLALLIFIKHQYVNWDRITISVQPSKTNTYSFTADTSLYHLSSHEGKMVTHLNIFSPEFLSYFPKTIGFWKGEDFENPYADISLFRLYQHSKTKQALWFIVVYGSHESQFHSPEVCYISDGWDVAKREIKKVNVEGEEFPIRYMIAQKGNNIHMVSSWYVWPSSRRKLGEGTLFFRLSVELNQNEEEGQKALLDFLENFSRLAIIQKEKISLPEPLKRGVVPPVTVKKNKTTDWILNQRVPNTLVPFPEMDRRYLFLSFELNPNHPKTQSDKSYPYIYSRASTYDNALALIALSMMGKDTEAKTLIDAFERIRRDNGELWFSYNTHNEWPSEKNHDEAIIRTGASAWVGYAITFFLRKTETKDERYLRLAKLITDALLKDQILDSKDPRYGLVTGGQGSHELKMENQKIIEKFHSKKIEWASVEHNLDMYFLLKNMFILTKEHKYEDAMEKVKNALLRAWNEKEGQFNRGIRVTGVDDAMALDCASWGILFLLSIGEVEKAKKALKTLEKYRVIDPIAQVEGYRPYYKGLIFDELHLNKLFYPHKPDKSWADIQMVWSEGSLGVAMAYLKMGEKEKARKVLSEMTKMQTTSGGLKYSTQEIPFQFSPSPSMAGTAWFALVSLALENPTILQLFWE